MRILLLLLRMLWLGARMELWLLAKRGLCGLGLETPKLAAKMAQRFRRLAADARALRAECRQPVPLQNAIDHEGANLCPPT